MSAETTLYAILAGASGVTDLVGTRIYPDLVPQEKAVPYIGYERVGTEPIATIHGSVVAENVRLLVACWSATRLQAEQIADAVEAAMQAAGYIYAARGAELDETTGRLAATLDYEILST